MMREAEFIQRVFREAAPIVLGGDRTAEAKETALGVYDVVTDSDVRTEEFVLSRIAEEFPGDSVISEETHPDALEGERCWVLDPIDGTMNYAPWPASTCRSSTRCSWPRRRGRSSTGGR